MAAHRIPGLASALLSLALGAASASAATAQDVVCSGELTAVTVRSVAVPSGGSCVLRKSTVTAGVSAGAGAYFQAVGTRIDGDLVGTDAQTLFLEGGSSVRGGVRATRVAQVFLFASRVRKDVNVDRATDQVFICGTTVERGNIKVTRSARDIVIGDPGVGRCAGNSVRRGNMNVVGNRTDVQLVISGNRFPKGNLIVKGNTGPSDKIVQSNSGGRHIACQANAGRFRASKNRRWKTGGCNPS